MKNPSISRWTREGVLNFPWGNFETLEKLILTTSLLEKVNYRIDLFLRSRDEYHKFKLPWRYGVFLFGPSGSGKTSVGKAIAKSLNWNHFTIPSHEILDSHLLERALSDAMLSAERVVVLEDVDLMIKTMEPHVFFSLLDHAMERSEGFFWIANSRHPEETPKTQLLRPGRFDEAIRLEVPGSALRARLLKELLFDAVNTEVVNTEAVNTEIVNTEIVNTEMVDKEVVTSEGVIAEAIKTKNDTSGAILMTEWVEDTNGLSFSHFEELRQIKVKMILENKDLSDRVAALKSYVEDQMIAGDRLGGLSDSTEDLGERVRQIDPRVLMAALDMSDVFRRLMEKVIGDAAINASASKTGMDSEAGSH